jgi:hypothetical protein
MHIQQVSLLSPIHYMLTAMILASIESTAPEASVATKEFPVIPTQTAEPRDPNLGREFAFLLGRPANNRQLLHDTANLLG